MKLEQYEPVELTVIYFETYDVVTASGDNLDPDFH